MTTEPDKSQPTPDDDPLIDEVLRKAFQGDFELPSVRFGPLPGDSRTPDTMGPGHAVDDRTTEAALIGLVEESRRYRVRGTLGRGGMGIVFRAWDLDLAREVAIKLQKPGTRGDAAWKRFMREARIAGRVQHPGVLPVYDVGRLANDVPYFTMRLVEGETLRDRLARREDPEEDRSELLRILRQVAEAVACAHARRIIHRDLKPANVLLGTFGEVQVTDWGAAKVLAAPDDATGSSESPEVNDDSDSLDTDDLTVAGQVVGTPRYMAPEQARGEALDARSDVFALGALLCQILTGKGPYGEASGAHLIAAARMGRLEGAIARLDRIQGPNELKDLARRSIAADPRERPCNAGVFAEELIRIRSASEERARIAEIEAAEQRSRAEHETRRRRMVLLYGSALFLLFAMVAASYVMFVFEAERNKDTKNRQRSVNTKEAQSIITRVTGLMAEGRMAPDVEKRPAALTECLSVAQTGLARAQKEDVDADVQASLESLTADVRRFLALAQADAKRLRRDRETRERLRKVREDLSSGSSVDMGDRAFQKIFEDYGVVVSDEETRQAAIERICRSDIRDALVEGLETWAVARMGADRLRGERFKVLIEVAAACETKSGRASLVERIFEALSKKQEPSKALLLQAAETLPSSLLHILASQLGRRLDAKTAIKLYRRGVERHRSDFWLRMGLGYWLSHRTAEELKEAAEHYFAATVLAPQNGVGHLNAGICYRRLGRREESEHHLKLALKLIRNKWQVQFNLGLLELDRRDHEAALYAFRRAGALVPGNAEVFQWMATTLERMGRFDRALTTYTKAIRLSKRPVLALSVGAARCEARLKKPAAAEARLRKMLEKHPKHAEGWYELGLLFDRTGRKDEGRKFLRNAVKHSRGYKYAYSLASSLMGRRPTGKVALEEATRLLERVVEERPRFAQGHFNYAEALRRHSRYTEAVHWFEKAWSLLPENSPQRKRFKAAVAHAKRNERLEKRLLSILNGRAADVDEAEWFALANHVRKSGRPRMEARLWVRACGESDLAESPRALFNAIISGVAMLEGRGLEDPLMDDAARARWSAQIVAWFDDVVKLPDRDGVRAASSAFFASLRSLSVTPEDLARILEQDDAARAQALWRKLARFTRS